MNLCRSSVVFLVTLSCSVAAIAGDIVEELIVTDRLISAGVLNTEQVHDSAAVDGAELLRQIPGGHRAFNGALSAQTFYRGMSGPRMNVRVEGQYINSGGPNWMDPPLHYAPRGLIETLSFERGISSVASGSGIGGHVQVALKKPDYALQNSGEQGADQQQGWKLAGDLVSGAASNDESLNGAVMLGLVNRHHRIYTLGSIEDGDDYESGGGRVRATAYERSTWGFGYGFQNERQSLDVLLRRVESNEAGTPALPLDIAFFNTTLISAQHSIAVGAGHIKSRLYASDIEHQMANFLLREAPDNSSLPLPPFVGDDKRFVDASSEGLGWSVALQWPLFGGELEVGVDGHQADHEATVRDPDFAPFFVRNFNDTQRRALGSYLQWRGEAMERLSLESGVRIERVQMRTGEVDAFPARLVDMAPAMWPMGTPPRAVFLLRERFNDAHRRRSDVNFDWVLKGRYTVTDELSAVAGIARKVRSPLYQERFLWIPLEVNAGLGDGNNYVGNMSLRPEISHQFELGLQYTGERFEFSPRVHYRTVQDFIQGTPVTDMATVAVSGNANGDATPLMFSNVDAQVWGLDAQWSVHLNEALKLRGQLSWLRGRSDDLGDDLYRIAAPSALFALSWQHRGFSAELQQELVARQDRRSATLTLDPGNGNNSHEATPGYGLTHLHLALRFEQAALRGLTLRGGVENLFDRRYIDHLSGFNRVQNSDADVGRRLPGRGRNLYMRLRYAW